MPLPRTSLFAFALCGALAACARPDPFFLGVSARGGAARNRERAPEPQSDFAPSTHSPDPARASEDPVERALQRACGPSDAALVHVAAELARSAASEDSVDIAALTYDLRANGAPYVWPRAWRFDGTERQLDDAGARLQRWLTGFGDSALRRCGVALARGAQRRVTAFAIAADALADLEPVPTRVRVGQWVDVRAELHVPADAAKLVVLGPRGAPHAVPSTLDRAHFAARFNADHEGRYLVQVLGSVEGGPRPLLEALIFAGVEPPAKFRLEKAPGEDGASAEDPRAALYEMVNAARASERIAKLARAPELEALAQAHAEAMRRAHKTAHDAGDGDLLQRLANAGLELRAGENVAHAGSAALAHRSLWASPSHHENLLFPDYDALGIGVAPDDDGTLWVCEVFANWPEGSSAPK